MFFFVLFCFAYSVIYAGSASEQSSLSLHDPKTALKGEGSYINLALRSLVTRPMTYLNYNRDVSGSLGRDIVSLFSSHIHTSHLNFPVNVSGCQWGLDNDYLAGRM